MAKQKQQRAQRQSIHSPFSRDEKLLCLRVLDENNMSVSETSYQLGVSRVSLYKWKDELWEDYLAAKEEIADKMLTVQAKKLIMYEGTDKTVTNTQKLFDLGIEHLLEAENFAMLENKEKIELLKTIAPYVLEKKVVAGVKDNTPKTQNFYTNILNQLKENNNGSSNNTIQGH